MATLQAQPWWHSTDAEMFALVNLVMSYLGAQVGPLFPSSRRLSILQSMLRSIRILILLSSCDRSCNALLMRM